MLVVRASIRPKFGSSRDLPYFPNTLLVIALIAGVLGLGLVAGLALEIARILFVVFLVLFIVSLIAGRRPPV